MREIEVCPLAELPPGSVRIVHVEGFLSIGVYNCGGELYALEDRCSHDDGPLCEGDFDCEEQGRDLSASWRPLRHHDRPTALPAGLSPG